MKQVQQKKQTNNEILPTDIINRFIKDRSLRRPVHGRGETCREH